MKKIYFATSASLKSLAAGIMLLAVLIPFSGQSQSITLLAPNGGEAWLVDSYEDVSWTGQGLGNVLRLDFSPTVESTGGTLERFLRPRTEAAQWLVFPPTSAKMLCSKSPT
jgi:hypothetical protein